MICMPNVKMGEGVLSGKRVRLGVFFPFFSFLSVFGRTTGG